MSSNLKSERELALQEIIDAFVRRGGTRPDAIQFIERHQSSTSWNNIVDGELRNLIERYRDARYGRYRDDLES